MTCAQDQTNRDVLCGASDAVLELGGSKVHSFVCGDEESDQSALRNTQYVHKRIKSTISDIFDSSSGSTRSGANIVDVDGERAKYGPVRAPWTSTTNSRKFAFEADRHPDMTSNPKGPVKSTDTDGQSHKISMDIILACLDSLQTLNSLP